MRKIDIQDLIQLLGMIGVIGSLVFVGLEMRQSQTIARATQQQDRAAILVDVVNSFYEVDVDMQSTYFEKKFALSLEFETKVFPVSFGLGILRLIGLILRNFLDIKKDISLNFPLLWVPINIFFIST